MNWLHYAKEFLDELESGAEFHIFNNEGIIEFYRDRVLITSMSIAEARKRMAEEELQNQETVLQ